MASPRAAPSAAISAAPRSRSSASPSCPAGSARGTGEGPRPSAGGCHTHSVRSRGEVQGVGPRPRTHPPRVAHRPALRPVVICFVQPALHVAQHVLRLALGPVHLALRLQAGVARQPAGSVLDATLQVVARAPEVVLSATLSEILVRHTGSSLADVPPVQRTRTAQEG